MELIIVVLTFALIMWVSFLVGRYLTKDHYEQLRKEDNRTMMKMLKGEYERGYRDGFMSKVTPNNLRAVVGLPPLKEVSNDFRKLDNP